MNTKTDELGFVEEVLDTVNRVRAKGQDRLSMIANAAKSHRVGQHVNTGEPYGVPGMTTSPAKHAARVGRRRLRSH